MGRIETKIVHVLNIQDEKERQKEFEIMYSKMLDELKGKKWNEKANILYNLNLDYKEKLRFLILCSFNKKNESFSMETIPIIINTLIKNNEEKFFELVSDDEETQSIYADYLKEAPSRIMDNYDNNLEAILCLPMVKEKILEDEEFIAKYFSSDSIFMEKLPKEYGYLISLYKTTNDKDFINIKKLYSKFFGDELTQKEQIEFIRLQDEISNTKNGLKLNIKIATKELLFNLKQILLDKSYYEKIKNLEERIGLNLKEIISFLYKYHDSALLETILKTNEIDRDLVDKIKYLSSENRVLNAEILTDLSRYSLEDLKKMEKERIIDFNSNLYSAPTGKIDKTLFMGGSNREIRRIDIDGKNKIMVLPLFSGHEEGVLEIYKGDIEFEKSDLHVKKSCMEAVKKLSSITFVIEGEVCHIYTPSNMTIDQKLISCDWIEKSAKDGSFSILAYDKNQDMEYVVCDDNNKDQIREKILDLGEKVTEEQLEEYRKSLNRFKLDEVLAELEEIEKTAKISTFNETSENMNNNVLKERTDEFEEEGCEIDEGW